MTGGDSEESDLPRAHPPLEQLPGHAAPRIQPGADDHHSRALWRRTHPGERLRHGIQQIHLRHPQPELPQGAQALPDPLLVAGEGDFQSGLAGVGEQGDLVFRPQSRQQVIGRS